MANIKPVNLLPHNKFSGGIGMTRQLLVALFFVIFTVKGADAELVERYVPGVDYTVIQNTQNT